MIHVLKEMSGGLRAAAGVAAGVLLLTLVLGYMVVDRVRLLSSGREIVLPIRPVDPRDLFKGDYAQLGYDISLIDGKDISYGAFIPTGLAVRNREQDVFVTLEQDASGVWRSIAASATLPSNLAANQVAIAGKVIARQSDGRIRVRYGLERYFVPEGTGDRIEEMARKATLSAIIAVDRHGRAAIKGLVIDGQKVYEEPLI